MAHACASVRMVPLPCCLCSILDFRASCLGCGDTKQNGRLGPWNDRGKLNVAVPRGAEGAAMTGRSRRFGRPLLRNNKRLRTIWICRITGFACFAVNFGCFAAISNGFLCSFSCPSQWWPWFCRVCIVECCDGPLCIVQGVDGFP